MERSFYTTSSCGLCGKASIEAVATHSAYEVRDDALRVSAQLLATLPDRLGEVPGAPVIGEIVPRRQRAIEVR